MALTPPKERRKVGNYNIDPDALDLIKHLEKLLDTVVGVYEQAGVPLPERRYFMVGPPPEDCAQVVVSLVQVYLGIPGDQAAEIQKCDAPATAVVNIHVTRDYPIGELGKTVPARDIMDASSWSAVDSWLMFKAMQEFDKDEFGYAGPGAIATVTARPPGGAVQTTVLNLSTVVM
ncbi:hypothetical protein SEA_CECE_76 [Microbacterium phage Cece]|nr:hypothetical protein SEA_CECE_76 [Microbacterium phage Cece]